jgi:RHS repeat-associated protein
LLGGKLVENRFGDATEFTGSRCRKAAIEALFGEEVPANDATRNSQWGAQMDTVETKFTGQVRDLENGLDWFNARYYGPALGRFMSPDPGQAGVDPTDPQTWNGYGYVRNSPLALVDPSGMQSGSPCENNFSCMSQIPGCLANFSECIQKYFATDPLQVWSSLDALQIASGYYWNDGWNAIYGGVFLFTDTVYTNSSTQSSKPPAKNGNCQAGVVGNFVSKYIGGNTILSGNITTNTPTIELGAAIGSLAGPPGEFAGALIGSMFGVGGSVSYVPGTGSIYAGPVATFGVGINGGSGFSVSAVHVPASQNANSIASGKSFSLSYQPNPFLGSNVTKSPGSGPPVVGLTIGTKVPVSASAGYSFCLGHCGC